MSKRILEYDPFSRITRYFHYDHSTETATIESVQDTSLILDANKTLQNNPDVWKQGVKRSWAHYATIPNIIIEKWLNEFGVDAYNKDHQKKVFSLLNQPEYKYLKTTTKMHWG